MSAPPSPLGRPRLHLRRTDSTNERARGLALGGAPHGTLVTAEEQTAGRGRQGRRWVAPPGSSLLMSLVLRPPGTEPMPPALSLLAGVAVCDVAGAGARVKWPNDVVREGPGGPAKLGGILVEGRPREGWAVLGIGLNVAVDLGELPAELRGTAATLGRPRGEIEPTLTALLGALQRRLREPVGEVLDAWRARDALRGREIRWAGGAGALAGREAEDRPGSARGERHGVAEGIDGEGRLIVALPGGGRTALDAGEVHLAGTQVYSFGG